MSLKKRVFKSSKKGTGPALGLVIGLIIALIVFLISITIGWTWFTNIFKGAETITDCKTLLGDCYSTCEGDHPFSVHGATGCSEGQVCCKKLTSGGGFEDPEDSSTEPEVSGETSCEDYEICYRSKHPDDTWQFAKKWYNGNKEKNCFYLSPIFDLEEPETQPVNGQILSKGYEDVTFVASAPAKCCLLQVGGINKNYESYGYAYFGGQFDRETTGRIPWNETTKTCTASLDFDFANPDTKIFDKGVWNESTDDRTFCKQEDALEQPRKAMFKVDFVYWSEECGDNSNRPGFLATSANSVATLFDVAKFDPEKYGYEEEEELPGWPEQDYFINLRLAIRPRLGRINNNPVCDIYCEKTVRHSNNPSPVIEKCNYVAFVEVDADEDCPAEKFKQVSQDDELFYKKFYDGQIFVDRILKSDYFPVDPNKKICLIGASDEKFHANVFSKGACSEIYYTNPEKDTPDGPCEVDRCSEISSEQGCNEIQNVLAGEDTNWDLSFDLYPDEYCEDLNCYYGTDGWFTFNKCRDCSLITECSSYNKKDACVTNPCKLGISSTLTGGCFWNNKCKQCPGSCEMLSENDCAQSDECGLDCIWDEQSDMCVDDESV